MARPPADNASMDDFEDRLERLEEEVEAVAQLQRATLDEMRVRWREEDALLRTLELRAEMEVQAVRTQRDDTHGLEQQLATLRSSADYERSWDNERPLVSVRIATYDRTDALIDVAIESVLRQTYDNIEIVVVNDGPNAVTRTAIEALGESKIRFSELPKRGLYPVDAHLRWMVAGAPAMNEAARLARGDWIAPLDDDDEFAADHIEKLVALACAERAEFAYGALIQRDMVEGVDRVVYSDPPRIGAFSFQSTLYLSGLRFFEYDVESWRVGEPADWNLARRMVGAGVRMVSTDEVHAFMNSTRFDKRGDS